MVTLVQLDHVEQAPGVFPIHRHHAFAAADVVRAPREVLLVRVDGKHHRQHLAVAAVLRAVRHAA